MSASKDLARRRIVAICTARPPDPGELGAGLNDGCTAMPKGRAFVARGDGGRGESGEIFTGGAWVTHAPYWGDDE